MTERASNKRDEEIKINHHALMSKLTDLDGHYYITLEHLMKLIEDCKDD